MKRLLFSLAVLVFGLALSAGHVLPAAAQQGAVNWTTDFYNNYYLSGSPVLTRRDSAVAFNWGGGSPGAGVSADYWSARIWTDVHFNAGTHRFNVMADDAVTLWVDFRSYFSTFDNAKPGQLLTADVTFSRSGTYHIQLDYREATGNAYVYLSWTDMATGISTPSNPVSGPPQYVPVGGALWTAEYYNNPWLSGTPVAILGAATPSANWGSGAPLANVPADNFSVRWRSTQYLDGSPYQISVRADDGVRVFVNGVAYINEWHQASGQTYTASVNLPVGYHNFVVEYYEGGGLAFLDYSLSRLSTAPQPPTYNPPPVTANPNVTVTTGMLNVRNAPNAITGAILTKIPRGAVYPVVGRNADASWWQVNVNGTVGWVNASYVRAANTGNVPVAGTAPPVTQPQPTGFTATAIVNVNMRSGPGTSFAVRTVIPRGSQVPIIGRNAGNSWYQVNYNGVEGWVSAAYAIAGWNTNFSAIPVR